MNKSEYIQKSIRITEEDQNNNDEVLFDSIIEGSDISKITYKENINIVNNSNNFDEMASSKINDNNSFISQVQNIQNAVKRNNYSPHNGKDLQSLMQSPMSQLATN